MTESVQLSTKTLKAMLAAIDKYGEVERIHASMKLYTRQNAQKYGAGLKQAQEVVPLVKRKLILAIDAAIREAVLNAQNNTVPTVEQLEQDNGRIEASDPGTNVDNKRPIQGV